MTIHTLVINLDTAHDRLSSIKNMLAVWQIDFSRVSAVDGRKFDLSDFPSYNKKHAVRYMGRALVGGEIGCYLSHLKAAQAFLQTDASHGLILEDDACIALDLQSLLQSALDDLDDIDPDWLVINIGNNKLKIFSKIKEYSVNGSTHTLVAAHYFPMTTSALVWSRKGARQFIDDHKEIFCPVDNFLRHWITRSGHGYSFNPPLVSVTNAATQIISTSGGQRSSQERDWTYGIAKQKRLWIDKFIAIQKKIQYRFQ